MAKAYTQEQKDQITSLYVDEKLSASQVAKKLGLSREGVRGYLRRNKLLRSKAEANRVRHGEDIEERIQKGLELYRTGWSSVKAAKEAGVSEAVIRRRARKAGIARSIKFYKSPQRRASKQKMLDVGSKAYDEGSSIQSIAQEMGMKPQAVWKLAHRYAKTMGIQSPHKNKVVSNIRTALMLRQRGMTLDSIARYLGISRNQVWRYTKNPEKFKAWQAVKNKELS